MVSEIKKYVASSSTNPELFKTIECQIMDIADDIAYSTYDFEDALKSEFLSPLDMHWNCAATGNLEPSLHRLW